MGYAKHPRTHQMKPRHHYITPMSTIIDLWGRINKRRNGTEKLSVAVEDLKNLLQDHQEMCDELERD